MTRDSRGDAVRAIEKTGQTQSNRQNKRVAQSLVGIGLSIVYLADQVGELVTAIKEQPQQPQVSIEIQNPGGSDENDSDRKSKGGNG